MKHFATPFDVHADRASRGGDDYLNLAAQLAAEAKTKTPSDGVFTLPVLREVSHLHDLERECYDALGVCIRQQQRATRRAYQHMQLVKVCNTTQATLPAIKRQSLAQVSAQFSNKRRDEAPPGHLVTLSPIATCAASNAPGLVRHAITTGDTATSN